MNMENLTVNPVEPVVLISGAGPSCAETEAMRRTSLNLCRGLIFHCLKQQATDVLPSKAHWDRKSLVEYMERALKRVRISHPEVNFVERRGEKC